MIEQWIYKTIIAFLSIQIIQIVFGKYLVILMKSRNAKPIGTFRALLNSILLSMLPVLRWFFVGVLLLGAFMGMSIGGNDER